MSNKLYGLTFQPGKLYKTTGHFRLERNDVGIYFFADAVIPKINHVFLVLEETTLAAPLAVGYEQYNFYKVLLGQKLIETFYVSSCYKNLVVEVK